MFVDSENLKLEKIGFDDDEIIIYVTSAQNTAVCPGCYKISNRKHSSYTRKPKDLACMGTPVRLYLSVRRFFCDTPDCAYQIFTERLPKIVAPYSRNTCRLTDVLRAIAYASGGEEGSRLSMKQGYKVSADSLIRIIRRTQNVKKIDTPRVLGVDDWAFRKGIKYGTILIDHEKKSVIDLLPDRKAETFEAWLKEHSGIEIVTRDRSSSYKTAIDNGLPDAIQVADRWHLLKNLTETIQLLLVRFNKKIAETTNLLYPKEENEATYDNNFKSDSNSKLTKTKEQKIKENRRERRLNRYNQVIDLRSKGNGIKTIAKKTGISRNTIRRYLSVEEFPEISSRFSRSSILKNFKAYIEKRWNEGCHNVMQLWNEVCIQGCQGSYSLVKRYITMCYGESIRKIKKQNLIKKIEQARQGIIPSPKEVTFIVLSEEKNLEEKDKLLKKKLFELCPEIAKSVDIGREFQRIVKGKDIDKLDECVKAMEQSGKELNSFARGLKADWEAVRNAITLKWSNGRTEGYVNYLKLIKRKMYGRANFDLLKLRVLQNN